MRFAIAVILSLSVVSCTANSPEDVLGAAQAQERAAWEREAAEATEPFSPTGEWEQLAPGVWRMYEVDEHGGVAESFHTEGLEGLAWMVENISQPRLEILQAQLQTASGDVKAELQSEMRFYREDIEMYKQWLSAETSTQELELSQTCSAYASASAGPTTSSQGAKAYANSQTCTSGRSATGTAHATSNVASEINDYVRPAGSAGSASAVAYGLGCSSSSSANGYPYTQRATYRC